MRIYTNEENIVQAGILPLRIMAVGQIIESTQMYLQDIIRGLGLQ